MYHYSRFWLIPGVEHGEHLAPLQEKLLESGVPEWISEAYSIPLVNGQEAGNEHAFFAAWMAFAICALFALIARAGLGKARAKGGMTQYVPDANLGPRNALEMLIEAILNFAESTLGNRDLAVRYFPLFGSVFMYVLVCNLIGLIPGFLPATSSVSTNFAVAMVVFVCFLFAGFKEAGMGFVKHLGGPILILWPAIFVLETFSLLIRPVTLSWRLYINVFADHLLLGVSSDMTHGILVPAAFVGLGTFVSFVQAFVFMMLAVVYVALSVGDGDHH